MDLLKHFKLDPFNRECYGFGGGKPPAVPKPPPPPEIVDPEILKKQQQEAEALRRKRGRSASILTSPQGLTTQPILGHATLLGG